MNVALPVEILTTILVDCIVDHPDYTAAPHRATYTYLADISLAISHACRLWRNIALSPGGRRLWAHAPLRHKPACVDAFMQRSHPLPVLLKFEAILIDDFDPMKSYLPAVFKALEYRTRVGSLLLRLIVDEYSDYPDEHKQEYYDACATMSNILDEHTFPTLEYLSWRSFIKEDGEEISGNVFTSDVPRSLRRLDLATITTTSRNPILRAPLTSLVLERCGCWLGVDDFISTLHNMPLLETLAISSEGGPETFEELESSTRHQRRSVTLPRLSRLALHDTLENTVLLFAYLHVPVTCRIDMAPSYDHYRPIEDSRQYWEHWSVLRTALRAHFEPFAFERIVVSGIGDRSDRFLISASSATLPTMDLNFVCHPEEFCLTDMHLLRTLRDLLLLPFLSRASTIVAQDIRVLQPLLYQFSDHDEGQSIASPFSAVRNAIVADAATDDIGRALSDPSLLPALQTIEVRQMLVDDGRDTESSQWKFGALLRGLWARGRLDSVQAIQTVNLRHCAVVKEAVDALAASVHARISWDGLCVYPDRNVSKKIARLDDQAEHVGILAQILDR
ncbi:unnamed protein product [Peniophora sp. CBMAI 1063]|nr:unnamed protein product [Peniophora sp. CBMAI 1063]